MIRDTSLETGSSIVNEIPYLQEHTLTLVEGSPLEELCQATVITNEAELEEVSNHDSERGAKHEAIMRSIAEPLAGHIRSIFHVAREVHMPVAKEVYAHFKNSLDTYETDFEEECSTMEAIELIPYGLPRIFAEDEIVEILNKFPVENRYGKEFVVDTRAFELNIPEVLTNTGLAYVDAWFQTRLDEEGLLSRSQIREVIRQSTTTTPAEDELYKTPHRFELLFTNMMFWRTLSLRSDLDQDLIRSAYHAYTYWASTLSRAVSLYEQQAELGLLIERQLTSRSIIDRNITYRPKMQGLYVYAHNYNKLIRAGYGVELLLGYIFSEDHNFTLTVDEIIEDADTFIAQFKRKVLVRDKAIKDRKIVNYRFLLKRAIDQVYSKDSVIGRYYDAGFTKEDLDKAGITNQSKSAARVFGDHIDSINNENSIPLDETIINLVTLVFADAGPIRDILLQLKTFDEDGFLDFDLTPEKVGIVFSELVVGFILEQLN